jgi:hypothetical protein
MNDNRRRFLRGLGALGTMAALGGRMAKAENKPAGEQAMHAPEFHIDHVTAAARSLRHMQDALAAVGLHSENGGPHSNHATEMALVSFPDGSYLELIALQANAVPEAVAAHYWSKFLNADAGPCAWAVDVPDVAAEARRLSAAGIQVTTPARNGRTRLDGVHLEWDFARVGPGPNGTFFPFLIRDVTPRANRVYPSGKPTTTAFGGVARVVLGVQDLDKSIALYQRAYNLAPPLRQQDRELQAQLAWFKGTPVILAAPLSSSAAGPLAARVTQFGDAPCAFILKRTAQFKPADLPLHSQWFDRQVSWFDPAKLGWRLGAE